MQGHFPEIGGVTKPLVTYNATLEEIVNVVRCRRERLMRALGLIDFVLPSSFFKKWMRILFLLTSLFCV